MGILCSKDEDRTARIVKLSPKNIDDQRVQYCTSSPDDSLFVILFRHRFVVYHKLTMGIVRELSIGSDQIGESARFSRCGRFFFVVCESIIKKWNIEKGFKMETSVAGTPKLVGNLILNTHNLRQRSAKFSKGRRYLDKKCMEKGSTPEILALSQRFTLFCVKKTTAGEVPPKQTFALEDESTNKYFSLETQLKHPQAQIHDHQSSLAIHDQETINLYTLTTWPPHLLKTINTKETLQHTWGIAQLSFFHLTTKLATLHFAPQREVVIWDLVDFVPVCRFVSPQTGWMVLKNFSISQMDQNIDFTFTGGRLQSCSLTAPFRYLALLRYQRRCRVVQKLPASLFRELKAYLRCWS